MAPLREWIGRLWGTVRRTWRDGDLEEELRLHLELAADDMRRRGLSRLDAARAAGLQAGGVVQAMEALRDQRGVPWLDDLARDLRHGLRALRRNPAFTAVALLTLGIGIGATTAIFSVVEAILIRPLPYRDADRVVHIVSHRMDGNKPVRTWTMARPYFVGLRERAQTLSVIGGYDSFSNLTRQRLSTMVDGSQGAAELVGTRISPVLLDMLGVHPALGRVFEPVEEKPGHNGVIILSYGAWRTHYGGDPAVLGRLLTLDNRTYSLVGVMPQGFEFPDRQTDFWIPLTPAPVPPPSAPRSDSPDSGYADGVFGLLKEGVSSQAAAAEVESILRRLDLELALGRHQSVDASGFPTSMPRRAEVVSMKEELVAPVRPALRMLSLAVGLVLSIACANVLNLLLSRTASRAREVAIKVALGAARGRLIRQLLTETLVIAVAGGIVGVALAYWFIQIIVSFAPADIPRIEEVGLNRTAAMCAVVLSSFTGVAVGIMPALRTAKADRPATPARDSAAASPGWGLPRVATGALVIVGEIAMAMILFIAAALLIRSFITLVNVNPGYDAHNVLTFRVVLPPGRYADPREFYEALTTGLESMPAVQAAGATDVLPIAGTGGFHFVLGGLPATTGPADMMVMRIVSRHYFAAMGIHLIDGRLFSERDGSGQHRVVLVNREFARRYFGGVSPVGRTVTQDSSILEVIGVVDDVRHAGLDAEVTPEYYIDLRQFALGEATRPYFVVRSYSSPIELASTVRRVVHQIDPRAGVDLNISTMAEIVSGSVTRPRFYAVLLGIFAGVAVGLAAIGIYGVMAQSVAERSREMGIRVALGARRGQILAFVLRQGAVLTVSGMVIGLAGAAATTRYLQGMLFGLTPLDLTTFAAASLMVGAVATMASYIPARRATRADPVVALRCE